MRTPIAPIEVAADRVRQASIPRRWRDSDRRAARARRPSHRRRPWHAASQSYPRRTPTGSGLRDRRLIGRRRRRRNRRRWLRDRLRGGIRLWCGLRYRLRRRWLGYFRSVFHVSSSTKDRTTAVPTGADDDTDPHRARCFMRRRPTTILPRASAGVRDELLRRFVHPATLGSVVDREQGAAALVAARSIFRVRPSGTASAARREAADREALIVSLRHRHAPPFLDGFSRRRATRRWGDPNVARILQAGGSSVPRRSGMSNHTSVDPSALTPQRSARSPTR